MNIVHHNRKSGRLEPVPLPGAPFSHYYAQEPADEGIIMETDVTIKEVGKGEMITALGVTLPIAGWATKSEMITHQK